MAYSVHFAVDLEPLAEEVRVEFRTTLQEVADSIVTVPPANPFWVSIHASVLQIEIAGYRLSYRVLPRSRELHVIECQRRL